MKKGDCYKHAFNYVSKISKDEQDRYYIVHGIITAKVESKEDKGKQQIDHAWVEFEDVVFDTGRGVRKAGVCRKEEYYKFYSIEQKLVKRYTMSEAYKIGLNQGGHYGPWE